MFSNRDHCFVCYDNYVKLSNSILFFLVIYTIFLQCQALLMVVSGLISCHATKVIFFSCLCLYVILCWTIINKLIFLLISLLSYISRHFHFNHLWSSTLFPYMLKLIVFSLFYISLHKQLFIRFKVVTCFALTLIIYLLIVITMSAM